MPTLKKHIAVYLSADNERHLEKYCEEKGLKYSAAVNEILSMFFGEGERSKGNRPIRISSVLGLEDRLAEMTKRIEALEQR